MSRERRQASRTGRIAVLFLLFLLHLPLPASPADASRLLTNAEGGAFPSSKRFWFSVPDDCRLRLALDGEESYFGAGPASVDLAASEGEDKTYRLTAECLSSLPGSSILESREYLVRIDASRPPSPKISAVRSDGPIPSWTLSFSGEPGARVDSYVDDGSRILTLRGEPSASFQARRICGIAWSVDEAGNKSEPVPYSFEPFSMEVESPVPGSWGNSQRLIVDSSGASEIRWTDDGSDPFGPTGTSYAGPVLIGKQGDVEVAVAARSPDGREIRRLVRYSASPAPGGDALLAALRTAEAKPVLAERVLSIPEGAVWDIGVQGAAAAASSVGPALPGGREVILRPISTLCRVVPLFVRIGDKTSRFAFLLGGDGAFIASPPQPVQSSVADAASASLAVGSLRVAWWNDRSGSVRFRTAPDGAWKAAEEPVLIDPSGAEIEWLMVADRNSPSVRSEVFPPLSPSPTYPYASPLLAPAGKGAVLLAAPLSGGIRFALSSESFPTKDVDIPAGRTVSLDACDGEDLEIRVNGGGVSPSEAFRLDRRPPSAPILSAPDEGSWLFSAPEISALSSDGRVGMTVSWRRSDGSSGEYDLLSGGRLRPDSGAVVDYLVSARSTDAAGNVSPLTERRFRVDGSAVYVGSPRASASGDGSRDSPFLDLAKAVDVARRTGRSIVKVSSSAEIAAPVVLPAGIRIMGGYGDGFSDSTGSSSVLVHSPSAFVLRGGAAQVSFLSLQESVSRNRPAVEVLGGTLELSSVSIRPSSSASSLPAISVSKGSRFSASDCSFSGGAPVLVSAGANLSLKSCLMETSSVAAGKTLFMALTESVARIEDSRMVPASPSKGSSTGIEARGGSLLFVRSVAESSSEDSATCLSLKDVAFTADRFDVSASGGKFASAVSAVGGTIAWDEGSIAAKGHDAAALLGDSLSRSRIRGVKIFVSGSGVVRAIQVRGLFPGLSGSFFSAAANGTVAEALAGDAPGAGSVNGNEFSGFDFLYARSFDTDSIGSFNRRFAAADAPNKVKPAVDPQ